MEIVKPKSIWKRARGLKRHAPFEPVVMVLTSCSSIHTFGMKEAIDVWGLDKEGDVIHTISSLKPNKICFMGKEVVTVVECYSTHSESFKNQIICWIGERNE